MLRCVLARLTHLGIGVPAIALAVLVGVEAAHAQHVATRVQRFYSMDELAQLTPKSPNPYIAFLPENVEPDWEYWHSWRVVENQRRVAARGPRVAVDVPESEPNNTTQAPQVLQNFGTLPGQIREVAITGSAGFPPNVLAAEPTEDNGGIFGAATIPLSNSSRFYAVAGVIGNGAFGSSGFNSGDFDFYRINSVSAGKIIDIQLHATRKGSSLDPVVVIYDSSGEIVAGILDNIVTTIGNDTVKVDPDVSFTFVVPATGTYYVAVLGDSLENSLFLSNPFNGATGPGANSEGEYDLYIRLMDPVTTKNEDNGSISTATAVPSYGGIYNSTIGDGPFGENKGDFDFYAVPGLKKGDLLIADISAGLLGSTLDSFIAVWDGTGKLLTWNEDDPFGSIVFEHEGVTFLYFEFDSYAALEVPADGTYYVSVGAFLAPYPTDPFDPATGTGATSIGDYELALRVQPHNPDVFAMDLRAGDVFGADLTLHRGTVELLDPAGKRVVASQTNISAVYPEISPLPDQGSALAYVIPSNGRYYVRVSTDGQGAYTSNVSVFRPGLTSTLDPEPRQKLFIDFDGVIDFDVTIFDSTAEQPKLKNISPLSSFLDEWELEPDDENAVINSILAAVQESLRTDILYSGGDNRTFDIEILNSRDHPDPWGQTDVSRVIVGGTTGELEIETIGIAQSIDVGNFNTAETAIVLLDLLSDDAANPNSLNGIPRALNTSLVSLIGRAVGNIVAHEAGHFFGDFHTDNFITPPNIMDQGGNLANTIGLGADGIFGTADDIDVDFGKDHYSYLEGFTGVEDTLNLIAFGLPSLPGQIVYADFKKLENGNGSRIFPFNNLTDALSKVPSGGTIRIFPGSSNENYTGPLAIQKRVVLERTGTGSNNAVIGNH